MPSQRESKLIIALVLISLIGIISIFFTRYYALHDCKFTDERICSFIQSFNRNPGVSASGAYEQTEEFGEYNGVWKINQETEQFSMYKGDTEVMNIIIDNSYMYLKDYKDGMWWQQKREDSKLYETQLPFDPKVFFSSIKEYLNDEQTKFMFIQSLPCDKKQCHRFQMKNPKIRGQMFLYITTDTLELNRVISASEQSIFEIVVNNYEKPGIESPKEFKEATAKQNLFLEWIRQIKEKNTNYEYLNEFQEQREKSEGPTPIPTSTVISPTP